MAPTRTRAGYTARPKPRPSVSVSAGQVIQISRCPGQNADAEQAVDANFVYEAWIGCGGIGFSRSTDSGQTFSAPVTMPGSAGSVQRPSSALPQFGWDPAIAVAPDGAVYVSYMINRNGYAHPVVEVSSDHGARFTAVAPIIPPTRDNWGDRDFIAVAPDGTIYLTWDYGTSLKTQLANIVIQKSSDQGRSWSRISPVSPGFPDHGGGVAGPVLVEPDGRVNVLIWVLAGSGVTAPVLQPGYVYFTSSADDGRTWSSPVPVQPGTGVISRNVTWLDASLGIDSAGTLYATWDTQSPGGDIGWLSYSTDHGRTWSAARRATLDHDSAEHIMAVAGGRAGVAYVGWLADNARQGFAQYLRPFSVRDGWLCGPVLVSRAFGNRNVWPGDTIGISVLPSMQHGRTVVMLSWGSAVSSAVNPVGSLTSQIWAAVVASCGQGAAS